MALENVDMQDLLSTYQGFQGVDPTLVSQRIVQKFEREESEADARRELSLKGAKAGMTMDATLRDFSVAKLANPDLKLRDFMFGNPSVNAAYLQKGSGMIVSGKSQMPTFKERYANLNPFQKGGPNVVSNTVPPAQNPVSQTFAPPTLAQGSLKKPQPGFASALKMDPTGSQSPQKLVTNKAGYETYQDTLVGNEALDKFSLGPVKESLADLSGSKVAAEATEEVASKVGVEALKDVGGKAASAVDLYSTVKTLASETATDKEKASAVIGTGASAALSAGVVSGPIGWGLMGLSALLSLAPGRRQSSRTGKYV